MRQHTLPPQAQRDRRKNEPGESKAAPLLLALDILSASKDQGTGILCTQRGLLLFGAAGKSQMKERASEELRKGKGMEHRLQYPIRGHASSQSPSKHEAALQFHPQQQNKACLACRMPPSPATDRANQASLPAVILECVSIDLLHL